MFKHITTRNLYGDLEVKISFDAKSKRFKAFHAGVLNKKKYNVAKFATEKCKIFKDIEIMAEEVKAFRERHGIKMLNNYRRV